MSACYSGGFIEPLQDDHTLIVTASRVDRATLGCDQTRGAGFFGEAFFQKGMAGTNSFAAAFDVAKARVAERERAENVSSASDPQWWIGTAMADKLSGLRRGGPAGGVMTRGLVPRGSVWLRAADLRPRLTPHPRAATMGCRSWQSGCE